MAAVPAHDDNTDVPRVLPLPISPEIIGTVLGQQDKEKTSLNARQMRTLKRLLHGFTGCIVMVVESGIVPRGGMYRVEQFHIGPAEK